MDWRRPAEEKTRKNAVRTPAHVPRAVNTVKVDRFATAPGHPHFQQQTGAHNCAAEALMWTDQRNMDGGWNKSQSAVVARQGLEPRTCGL